MYHYLDEDDINWLTAAVASHSSKVVSILEGGYSLEESIPMTRPRKGKTSICDEQGDERNRKYPILPGDGGLVKGVVAHVLALSESSIR